MLKPVDKFARQQSMWLLLICCLAASSSASAAQQPSSRRAPYNRATKTEATTRATPLSEQELKVALDEALTLPLTERVERLKALASVARASSSSAESPTMTRAVELLVSSRAALGEERLKSGDLKGGVAQFRLAIDEAPSGMSNKLFVEVISRFPQNLFLRNQPAEALRAAKSIEAKIGNDPQRLIALAAFYLNVEADEDAVRVSEAAIKLAPDLAAGYQALGAAHHIKFEFDKAIAAYTRALELDAKSTQARRSLADLRRATGKPDEALALYRELLGDNPNDRVAQAGMVLSLFEAGQREDAERELGAALEAEPRNLPLLVGAAYWYAAHDAGRRALELAGRAVELEPRYTWAQIALARALIKEGRAIEAERALRTARRYGNFPTLAYELANTLAQLGLYEEAAAELAESFTIRNNVIRAKLGGRKTVESESFLELLAPERLAGIFQSVAAESEANARQLKSLLLFHLATNGATNGSGEREAASVKEAEAVAAAREFASGDDAMRLFRALYVAGRLLNHRVALDEVVKLAEAAASVVDQAVALPQATVAVVADQVRDVRARALAAGAFPPEAPVIASRVLSNIVRGRIEDTIGWAYFNAGKTTDAVARLRLAASVLPEASLWWRTGHWHLGAALEQSGDNSEALAAYLKSYNKQAPDRVRRTIIESLYRKINGSLEGLDSRIGQAPSPLPPSRSPATTDSPATTTSLAASRLHKRRQTSASNVATTTTAAATAAAAASVAEVTQPEADLTTDKSSTDRRTSIEMRTPARKRSSSSSSSGGRCTMSVSEESLTIDSSSGGSGTIIVRLEGGSSSPSSITFSNPNWAKIRVSGNEQVATNTGVATYTIASVSNTPGTYDITFKSPCGSKNVTVTLK